MSNPERNLKEETFGSIPMFVWTASIRKLGLHVALLGPHVYPLLDGVSLTDGSFCSWDAVGDATIALAETPQLIANFLEGKEATVVGANCAT